MTSQTSVGTAGARSSDNRDRARRGSSPAVLAIVVTHDGREWLGRCLTALNAQTYGPMEVLVVDDATGDARRRPQIRRIAKRHLRRRRWSCIRTPRPLGFGGARQLRSGRTKTNADLLLFLHDDARPRPDALERLVFRLEADPQTAIVGPKIVAWDDPDRLEEVGMAADRFGYPYKGLEAGEIDLGQHDHPAEVFFVTSTCMLVRHQVFRELRGWDARMRAFSEDLDLCWRARLAGHLVRVEPRARVAHAIALATEQRSSPFGPARYFSRRNRFRTVLKNASTPRLLALIPQIMLLTLGEMLGFIVLRQPREILNLARALGWNLLRAPQTLTERRRVQRTRKVPDRRFRRLMIKDTTRLRSYITHQAERMEEAWGRGSEMLTQQRTRAKAATQSLGVWVWVGGAAVSILAIAALRHFLFGPPAAVAELLPFPERAMQLWRLFLSPWHPAGLGQPGHSPPAFVILGLFSAVALGSAAVAQKLLVVVLGLVGAAGAYRLAGGYGLRAGRVTAALLYLFSGVGYAGIREGRLGALVFGAMAPFAMLAVGRLAGWARPPSFRYGRTVASLALSCAIAAAFVPGALIVMGIVAVVLCGLRALSGRRGESWRGLLGCGAGLASAWGLLLPWSLTWWSAGGPFDRLAGDGAWGAFARLFARSGATDALLGQVPEVPVLYGLALPAFGVIAVAVGDRPRRRLALALWAVIAVMGLFISLTGGGVIRPLIDSPAEAGVPIACAFTALAGIAVGSLRTGPARRGLGPRLVFMTGLASALFLAAAGLVPAAAAGEWRPGASLAPGRSHALESVRSVLQAEASGGRDFRVLWVGNLWGASENPVSTRPVDDRMLTGPEAGTLGDLFAPPSGPGERQLDRVIASIEQGATDRGGALLGTFNIAYVVLEREPGVSRWLAQRDLGVIRAEADYLLLENWASLDRAAVYNVLPAFVKALRDGDASATADDPLVERQALVSRSPSRLAAGDITGPGVVYVATQRDARWRAEVGDRRLEPVEGLWANAFRLPQGASGDLEVTYPLSWARLGLLAAVLLAWIVVVGAAFSAGTPPRTAPGVRR